jgi:hypothetical protein
MLARRLPRTVPVGPIVTLAGAGVIAVGSVLPWFTLSGPRHVFGTASISGTRFNGQITLILAVLIGQGAAVLWWHRAHREEFVRLLIGVPAFSVIMIGFSNMGREMARSPTIQHRRTHMLGPDCI